MYIFLNSFRCTNLYLNDLNISICVPAAFITQTVCLDDVTIRFEIWDTAGQERYHTLAPMYYRNAQAAIIVYDITNQVSTERQVLKFIN